MSLFVPCIPQINKRWRKGRLYGIKNLHLITLVGHVFNSSHACENTTSIRMGAHRDLLDRVYHMLNVCLCAF